MSRAFTNFFELFVVCVPAQHAPFIRFSRSAIFVSTFRDHFLGRFIYSRIIGAEISYTQMPPNMIESNLALMKITRNKNIGTKRSQLHPDACHKGDVP